MTRTPSKILYPLSVPSPGLRVKKATVASISSQPKASTVQALKGYHYLKSHSSRKVATS